MRRLAALAACLLAGFILFYAQARSPEPLARAAPANLFSAGRALQDIKIIAAAPHPTGSAADPQCTVDPQGGPVKRLAVLLAVIPATAFAKKPAPEPLGPPWPLVLASDVLYEARNVAPLLALLPRLTAAAGEVWLADPGRAPAAGFLAAAAERWRIDAIPHDGPAHVTVHRLRA